MAYITQYQADMDQNARNDRNMAAIGNGIQLFEENRRRAVDNDRKARLEKTAADEKALKDQRDAELYALQKDKLDYDKNQRALPYDQQDEFKKAKGLAAFKAPNSSSDLELYEKKQQIKNKYKDTQNDEGVAKAAQTKIIQNNIGLANVKNAMDSALTILQDKNVPEDQKIKTGQSLFKLLNSAEGADAVGAEEAKRIGSYLEYNLGNFTQPGAFIGRDLNGFTDQIKNYSTLLGDRVRRNEQTANGLKQGKAISETIQGPPQDDKAKLQRLQQLRAKKAGFAMGGQ